MLIEPLNNLKVMRSNLTKVLVVRRTIGGCFACHLAGTPGQNIILAFGHQHIELTLSGIVRKIVSLIVEGIKTSFDIPAYSPQRFLQRKSFRSQQRYCCYEAELLA